MCKPSENARNYEAGEKRRCAVGLGQPWRALVLFGDGVGNRTRREEHDADAVREWPCKPEGIARGRGFAASREQWAHARVCAWQRRRECGPGGGQLCTMPHKLITLNHATLRSIHVHVLQPPGTGRPKVASASLA